MIGEIQKFLFETGPLSDSKLVAKTKLENSGRNLVRNSAVAFGVTKIGLNNGGYGILEDIFYGMRNIEIPLEMLGIENPAEILANYSATGYLKRRNIHLDPNIPHDFFGLVNYINQNSYNNREFANLAKNFRKYFDEFPGMLKKRLGLLKRSVRDRFVKSFLADYKSSFNYDFDDPNRYGEDKGIYAKMIYEELTSLSDRFKKLSF